MSALPEHDISLEEYLKLEETSDIKHEYYLGQIFAMAGASENHNLIVGATYRSLDNQLEDKPCRPYISDFRLKIAAAKYTYPDLSVICGDTQLADGRKDTFTNPSVLIEVLSEGTESYDRGKKFELYRTIPSLQEYLLIAQDRPHVERYRRHGHAWVFTEYSTVDDEVVLDTIECILPLADIYKRVRFEMT